MTSLPVIAIVYYNSVITTTQHGSTLVSNEPKIVPLNKNMTLDSLKQVIQNKISLPYGKVVKHIHYRYPISFVSDCFYYRACKLQDNDDIITMFSLFGNSMTLHALSYMLPLRIHPYRHMHNHH